MDFGRKPTQEEIDAAIKREEHWKTPYIVVPSVEKQEFTLGQSYDRRAAITLQCRTCEGREFYVGQGDYLTVIKCKCCGWQEIIHDG